MARQIDILCSKQHNLCCWCGEFMPEGSRSIEHIIPLSFGPARGGTNAIENKAAAHCLCNSHRGSNIAFKPHPSTLFDFVRDRLSRIPQSMSQVWTDDPFRHEAPVHPPMTVARSKKIPDYLKIEFSTIILRKVPAGWVGMAASMRKNGRARVLRVTPPLPLRQMALANITAVIR